MNISIDDERLHVRATHVVASDETLTVTLEDGRTLTTPLAWYPRLMHGTPAERNRVEIGHFGIHWPDLDEDLSVKGMLLGHKSGESPKSLARWLRYRSKGQRVPVKTLPMPKWAADELRQTSKPRSKKTKQKTGV